MYRAFWRFLAGPKWVKAIEAVIILAAIVVTLFLKVFPWWEAKHPMDENVTQTSSAIILSPAEFDASAPMLA
ncbi:MAG: hypothetical protein SPI12_00925 [Actinomycetaceae bacterium]|nr:hypothetical protein [Actinomycetaceae bacterium]MDY6082411.1 hypothetical protein [Actinomycetaceae bacterium]